jgi:aspartate-semialdehyde dehydrogenase
MLKLALVGATGLVGREMIKVLEERFPSTEFDFFPVASEKSVGKRVTLNGKEFPVLSLQAAVDNKPNVALFSAGGSVSIEWAPKFSAVGCYVIDNSSAWRMHPEIRLLVPEINADEITENTKIIANPNCSTIQLVVALNLLHQKFKLKRLVVSTYQSITGTGAKAVHQLENERRGIEAEMIYPYQIDKNCIPQCDSFTDNGYTKEELKVINETKKIFNSPDISITCTAVRVPVVGGHSESVNAEFVNDISISTIREVLNNTPGVKVYDHPETLLYPMPINAKGKDHVFVGRIREDLEQKNTFNLWIVADNLRKGAATNAVQIMELLMQKGLVPLS